jgi:hypothetical protein
MLEAHLLEEHTPIAKPDTSVSAHKPRDCLSVSNDSVCNFKCHLGIAISQIQPAVGTQQAASSLPSGSKVQPVRMPSRAAKCVDPSRLRMN